MKDNEKAKELARDYFRRGQLGFVSTDTESAGFDCAIKMAKWKDEQYQQAKEELAKEIDNLIERVKEYEQRERIAQRIINDLRQNTLQHDAEFEHLFRYFQKNLTATLIGVKNGNGKQMFSTEAVAKTVEDFSNDLIAERKRYKDSKSKRCEVKIDNETIEETDDILRLCYNTILGVTGLDSDEDLIAARKKHDSSLVKRIEKVRKTFKELKSAK